MTIVLNGAARELAHVESGSSLSAVIAALELKADRIAVEQNGEIVRRAGWDAACVKEGDRLEIVHFVGGGSRVYLHTAP